MSFRWRVAAWIACVVVVLLTTFNLAISWSNARRIAARIDEDLWRRADEMTNPRRPPLRPPFGQPMGPPPDSPFPNDGSNLVASIRRPRVIGIAGNLIGGVRGDELFDPLAYRQSLSGGRVYSVVTLGGSRLRTLSAPAMKDGKVEFVVQVARELEDYDSVFRIQGNTLLLFLPLGVVLALAVSWFLTNRVLRPIKDLSDAAQAWRVGNLEKRIPVSGHDEFAVLSRAFNDMAESVQLSVTELNAALDRQKRFTADASHELRTPLTRLMIATSTDNVSEDDLRSSLASANRAAHDMAKVTSQLLELSYLESGDIAWSFQDIDLRLVVADAVEKSGGSADMQVFLPETAVTVFGNGDVLGRAVLNLLVNALKYGEPSVEVTLTTVDSIARVSVTDHGPGVPTELVGSLGERFFRIDPSRSQENGGTGLGLAIARESVQKNKGSLKFLSEPGSSFTAVIELPLSGR
ncbi:MAG: HAMP domain-containing histidine kinase [Chthonomonadaceae bacterium]|nr:HAMP domain-containing histidine kinase [Chthonomonadaceae bacterium]